MPTLNQPTGAPNPATIQPFITAVWTATSLVRDRGLLKLDTHGEVFTTLDPAYMPEAAPTPEELAAQIAILTALVNTKAGRDGTKEQSFSIGEEGSRIVLQSGKSGYTIYIDDQGLTENSVLHLGDLFPVIANSDILSQITQLPYIRVSEHTGPAYMDKVKELKFPDGSLTLDPANGVVSVSFAHVHSAQQITFTPSNPAAWAGTPPSQVKAALDQLGGRVTAIEGDANRAYYFTFADANARESGTGYVITASHLGLWAKQLDNLTYWELMAVSPLTWRKVIDPSESVSGHVADYPHPVSSITPPADRQGRFWFNPSNRIMYLYGTDHNEPIFQLDASGDLAEVFDPRLVELFCNTATGASGTTSTISYNANNNVDTITDILTGGVVRTVTLVYNGDDNCIGSTISVPALSYTKSEIPVRDSQNRVVSIINT